MRAARLQDALERLSAAIRDVESELVAMKAEHSAGVAYLCLRRHSRNVNDTACEVGFRGSLDEWERLMGAVVRR